MTWQIHDAAPPGLDTGSIRTASESSLQGFGNIFVRVSTKPEPRLNGQMIRGFGLKFDGVDTFATTQAVDLGGVHITREIKVDSDGSWTRFFDTFTNTTKEPVTVDVSFGGDLGYGSGKAQSIVQATSSGDKTITPEDSWTLAATPNQEQRPVGVVLGTPGPYPGALTKMGNQERNPFETPLAATGNEANFYGYVNSLTVKPDETKSLAHFVFLGATGSSAVSAAAKELKELAVDPEFSDLSSPEVCSLVNWDVSNLPWFDASVCPDVTRLDIPASPEAAQPYTTSKYDIVNKSIGEMQKDMEAGITTSEEITRAYLDRIAAYDSGQFGFNAFLYVATDAIDQAKAADQARKNGETGELLGIPIAIKDLYDTKDMPTTGGTLALEGWQPDTDAYQVEKLRESGAVLIGKTNMSEFANSGSY
ncbi:amidase, partial [Paenibacillus sepulcri]|nr:amidase [Paenibacillus sepulcri]